MKNTLLMLAVCVTLAGCAPQYYKDGAGQPEFNVDFAACQNDAPEITSQQNTSGNRAGAWAALLGDMGSIAAHNDYINNCLLADGWRKQTQQSTTAQSTTTPYTLAVAANAPFHDALVEADDKCAGMYAGDKNEAVAWSKCLKRVERPVWEKYAPTDLDEYDYYRAKITKLATRFHGGHIVSLRRVPPAPVSENVLKCS